MVLCKEGEAVLLEIAVPVRGLRVNHVLWDLVKRGHNGVNGVLVKRLVGKENVFGQDIVF